MKKLILVSLLLMVFTVGLNAQEGHRSPWLTNGDSLDFYLSGVTPCTTDVFPLYFYQTWKGFFNDTSDVRNDSCSFIVELYTSSFALTWDTTFTFAQTVFYAPNEFDGDSANVAYSGGPTRGKPFFAAAERFGALIIKSISTTGSALDSATVGRMYINGWSNQPGARLTK